MVSAGINATNPLVVNTDKGPITPTISTNYVIGFRDGNNVIELMMVERFPGHFRNIP